jgi:PilZ domain
MASEAKPPDHRRLRRIKGKGGTGVSCRKGALGLGKDLAIAVKDISVEGARLLVKEEIAAGTEVEITLAGVGGNKRVVRRATVAWCKAESPNFTIGVKFHDGLSYEDFFHLT